ncbi:hypothetical protein ABENE_11190 [Asticcacaulis benevestitus DSM 16100 = ATCC BAA-896]|uniref:FAD-dependent urate hydroxylase HpyO/Asp monooxygenase CreE-like FAD/NAD(P)-binding domain-containing protein n=1 Tax=Asticcacaulis benevestitus DSM 16100 = ATCC BAA-896 TaxID=1121022 RepID=V4RI46_9CAUL|nr:hypothetical protein ABENE_11190 [Asticcacaulis benevestitus DSM 16100 = ATCC BAA-896]
MHRLAIVGGGFGGSVLALKLAERDGQRPVLIEAARCAGAGLAYGAGGPDHLLNVPVHRMEVGLEPAFADWLADYPSEIAAGVAEAGDLAHAFVPRRLFGLYIQSHIDGAVAKGRILRIRGEVTQLQKDGATYVLGLVDGRQLNVARVVLATGNMAPKAPDLLSEDQKHLTDSPLFIPDPWASDALTAHEPDWPILLIGTGLTMVDIALSLSRQGHTGPIFALSRRGLLPLPHVSGGTWPAFLDIHIGQSPLKLLRRIRQEAKSALAKGVPWQRVLDAARPHAAQIWAAWTRAERSHFLRHARPYWDVHRHRVAPRVGRALEDLIEGRQVIPLSGRLKSFAPRGDHLDVAYSVRNRREIRHIKVARVINCTGPRSDYATLGTPLFAALRQQGFIHADPLGLGLETHDARVVDAHGHVSDSLFAIGSLTRPAWWEVTAVPELSAQISRLVEVLTRAEVLPSAVRPLSLALDFFDLGAGI